MGYAVRKTAGSAVVRNRIKRRLRAAIAAVDLRPGVDVVVSGGSEVADVDFQVLVEKLDRALEGAGATG